MTHASGTTADPAEARDRLRSLRARAAELRKLRAAAHFDHAERYRRLRDFCHDEGLEEEARWLDRQIARLER